MASLNLSEQTAAAVAADTLVVAVASQEGQPVLVGGSLLPRSTRQSLSKSLAELGATGSADEVIRIPAGADVAAKTITLTGLGEAQPGRKGYAAEVLRRAAGAASRSLTGVTSAAYVLPGTHVEQVAAIAEGALFGTYQFTRHLSKKASSSKKALPAITVLTPLAKDRAARAAATRASELSAALTLVRDLVNTAPGDLPPTGFVDAVLAATSADPITVTVLDEKALKKGGYGGILGVGQGSSRPPRLVKMSYQPSGASQHLALVGKGITFDSGGLSPKPSAAMETMKSDMAGGAAAVGAIIAIARLKVKLNVTVWVPLAENMPSGTAIRPSDVLTTYSGRTVEVLNTDAEGRLVLADGLAAASEEHPDVIVDIATLTGHQVLALGHRCSAIMSNDDALRDRIQRVAQQAGETMWPMPLPTDLRASMDSQVADIANIGERMGGMLVAGLFLKEFVGDRAGGVGQIPWAHLDIAGPSFNDLAPWGYTAKGGTGHGVRTLVRLAEDLVS